MKLRMEREEKQGKEKEEWEGKGVDLNQM